MSRFSPQFLDELRTRTTLSTLIGRSTKLTRAGREWRACCPFHHEKTPSFYVNDDKGFYHCFGCSAHGDAIRWLTEARGSDFIDAVKELADAAGMALPAPDPRAAEREVQKSGLHDVMAAAADWFEEQLRTQAGTEARDYLARRRLSAETIERFKIGYAPDRRDALKSALARFGEALLIEAGLLISVDDKTPYDRFRGRIMIPIRDPRGRVIAFGGRVLGPGEPKYLNSPDTPLFDKGRTLYNLDRAAPAARKGGRLIVVEGYMDVIALAQAGIDEVVAPLGTALTEDQLERLWRVVEIPTLCFDGDAAGRKASARAGERAMQLLRPGYSLSVVTLPEGNDPDEFVARKGLGLFEQFLVASEPLVSFMYRSEVERGKKETPEGRAKVQQRLRDLAAEVADPLVSSEYQTTFRDLFFEQFGFGKRRAEQIAAAISEARRYRPKSAGLDDAFERAVLFGLGRHPTVLRSELEAVCQLELQNIYHIRWRSVLVEAAMGDSPLDDDVLDTILERELFPVLERRDIAKDLAFSFFHRSHERATDDLRDVILLLVEEREVKDALIRAEARVSVTFTDAEWEEFEERRIAGQEMAGRRAAWVQRLQEAA